MKSVSTAFSVLGIGASVLSASGVAHAYGALLRLNATSGAQDTSFGTNGLVTSTASGDSYSSVIATPTVEYAAGAAQTGTNTTRPVVRTYLLGGSPASWAQGGTAILPSVSTAPAQHAQAIVRDSSNRIIAVCDDGTNVWLVRLDSSGNPDPTYGNNTLNPGVVSPFGGLGNGLALRAVGVKLLSDGRTIVVANNANGAAGFSLARVNAAGVVDLLSTGNSFGETATVSSAMDFAIDSHDNIAITGQSSTGDCGVITLTKDVVVPDKLVVNFRDTVHFTQYPNNHTFGSGVAFEPIAGSMTVVVGIQATPQYPVSGVRFRFRTYDNNYSSSPAWTLNDSLTGPYISGSTPQTTSPTWKVLPIEIIGPSGLPSLEYYVAGTSQTASGSYQFEVVKVTAVDPNTGLLQGDSAFGSNGEVHYPLSGYNAVGLNVAATGRGGTTNYPVVAGVVY